MHTISATQVKAARAMLDWSQGDLAIAAGVSLTTIRSFETGFPPRNNTLQKIRKIIEDSGLELTESEGIKRRNTEVKLFQGRDSCDRFFEDMLQTVNQKNCEVLASFKTKEIMLKSCGMIGNTLGYLEPLSKATHIKCLVAESLQSSLLIPSFQFRVIPKHLIGAISYFAYADKHAIILADSNSVFRFLVVNFGELAQSYNEQFLSLWNNAHPVLVTTASKRNRRSNI